VQCCGTNPDHVDVWDLYCPVDAATRNAVNLYGYELRLARNRDSEDETVITCPLKRSACTYSDTGETLSCDRVTDNTSLAGYTLRMKVREWDQLLGYWRGVESCEIETIEIAGQLPIGYQFHETLILDHPPISNLHTIEKDYSKLLILTVLVVFIGYGLLYWCRRKRCPYCQQKVVLAWNLCFTCQFYCVKLPDPVLLKALESKGEVLQGPIPERFPGSKMIVSLFRACYSAICGRCCCDLFAAKRKVHPQVVYEANVDMTMATKSMNLHAIKLNKEEEEEDTTDEEISLKEKTKKYQKDKEKWKKERLKEMKRNPQILDYDPELIFQAVEHPQFVPLKPNNIKTSFKN
jgi:hypothetical protein